jgi:phage internal scaffolding protein
MTKESKIKYRTAYSERIPCFFETTGESLTQIHLQDESNILNIIKKHDTQGIITNVQRGVARYGDFSQDVDYKESLNLIADAKENFMQLPSDIRKKFNNDPGQFFEFATNPDNESEMAKLGLIKSVNPPLETDKPIPKASEPQVAQEVSE